MYYVTLIAEYNHNVTFSLLRCWQRHDVKIPPVQMQWLHEDTVWLSHNFTWL